MKRTFVFSVIPAIVCFFGFKGADNLLTVSVRTKSNSETVAAKYVAQKWNKSARLVSISLTNNGDKTELIKDIQIKLNNPPPFNEKTKFLYGSSEMNSRSAIRQCGYDDKQTATESVLLVKYDDKQFFKIGVLTWEIFRASITFSKESGITISAEGENKPIRPGETIQFENLVIEEGDNWQDLLFDYGKQIAKIHNIKPKEIGEWKGFGTWDYFGHDFTYEDVKSNTEQIKKIFPGANVIQLDASWWVNRGDYLETRSNLPGGMKGMAKLIADNGCVAGLHLDGFRGIHTAKIYQEHPDWFLKDQDGKTIFGPYSRNGKEEKRVYFDYSNPGACEYIKHVLKTMTDDWGYKYIKVDFLAYGLNRNILEFQKDPDLKAIVAFDTTMTSMERSRAGLKAMREGIGKNYFLGCSSVFGPNYGLIDGLRTGPDIDPRFEAYRTHQLQNAGNFYLNQSVVQTDADYLVVRNKVDEDSTRAQGRNKFGGDVTLNEAKMWADYVTLFGGVKLSSDDLNLLRPERKELVRRAFAINTCTRFIPIDLWDKAKNLEDAFNIMLGTNDQGVYLALFNWDQEELGFELSNIPTQDIKLINNDEDQMFAAENGKLKTTLKGKSSVIFHLGEKARFDSLRNQLVYKFVK
jgi:alpha-galactosidase